MSIPVYIISGFLGAGKTTLLNHILNKNTDNLKYAVIVNDFGDVSIDGKLIEPDGIQIKEVAGGCICCSLRPQLNESVKTLASSDKFDILLIETTGIALPKEIGKDIDSLSNVCDVYNAGIIGVVDAVLYHKLPDSNLYMINRQLVESSIIIINKCDLLGNDKIIEVKKKLHAALDGRTKVISTSFGKINWKEFLHHGTKTAEANNRDFKQNLDECHHKYRQLTFSIKEAIQLKAIENLIKTYEDIVFRVKGMVITPEGKMFIQYSSSGFSTSTAAKNLPDKIVVILKDETDKIKQFKDRMNYILTSSGLKKE